MNFKLSGITTSGRNTNYIDFSRFLTVVKDTGYIDLPIDSIIANFSYDSLIWQASIEPTPDTTYAFSGKWIIKK